MPAITHNLLSQFTNRQLNITGNNKSKSSEKLSSGFRINRASDDAAGLAISEKMRWQVRGLNRASQNIQDGMSLLNVAEGALVEVHSMLQRMNELTIQAANDSNTYSDRSAIQREINQLLQAIEKVKSDTHFNTQPVFDGGTISGSGSVSGGSTVPPADPINDVTLSLPQGIDVAVNASNIDLLLHKNADGSYELEDGHTYTLASDITMTTFHVSNGATTAIKDSTLKDCGIICDNAELYVSSVIIRNTKSGYQGAPIECKGNTTINFLHLNNFESFFNYGVCYPGIQVENGNSLILNGNGFLSAQSYESAAGIGSQGVNTQNTDFDQDNRHMPMLKAGNITINSGYVTARCLRYKNNTSFYGSGIGGGRYSLNGNITINGGSVTASGSSGIGCGNPQNPTTAATPYRYKKYSPNDAGTVTICGGIVKADGIEGGAGIGGSEGGNGLNVIISGGTVNATGSKSNYNHASGAGIGSGACSFTDYGFNNKAECTSGNITITGGKVTAIGGELQDKTYGDRYTPASAVGMGGCTKLPDYGPNQAVNQAAQKKWFDGFEKLVIDGNAEDMYIEGRSDSNGDGRYIFTYERKTSDTSGTPDTPQGLWWIQMGATEGNGIFISTGKISLQDLGLNDLEVYSHQKACFAITKVQNAIDKVSTIRAHIGAQYNRLEHGVRIAENTAENTQTAESRIRDTDMALEMVSQFKHSILQQAGQSMLAQANQIPAGVLKLLQ